MSDAPLLEFPQMPSRDRPSPQGSTPKPTADLRWWQRAVIYQIYPRSFYDSNGDGVGDLPGILQRLDYVAALGVDAVWISPFYPSPMADFGYDISDYCGVDPLFGDLDDFKAVLARAHQLGLKVLIDQVWCHSSAQHPWFQASAADTTNDKADWYVWADAAPDGQPPNNWLATFGGPAWTWHSRRQQYYLHHFLPDQPALNWYNPAMQEAMLSVGRFWLDLGVDGFRFDVINFLLYDPELRDNPQRPPGAPLPAGGSDRLPFFHFINRHNIDQPATYPMLQKIRQLLESYPGRTSLAEISSSEDALATACQAVGPQRLHLAYNSTLMTEDPLTASHLRQIIHDAQPLLQSGGLCWTAGTHDFPRLASRWRKQLAEHQASTHNQAQGSVLFNQEAFNYMLAVLLLTLPGSCCLYQGDELGLPEAELPFEALRDPFGINNYPQFVGRDGCRTPMPWQAEAPQYGFSTNPNPWLPVALSHQALAVDRQEVQSQSLLHHYRQLIAWRRHQPALQEHFGIQVLDCVEGLFGYVRGPEQGNLGQTDSAQETGQVQRLLFLLNFTGQVQYQSLGSLPNCRAVTNLPYNGARQFDEQLEISAYGVFVARVV